MFICFYTEVICGFCMPIKAQSSYVQSHAREPANETVLEVLENHNQNALKDNVSLFSLPLHTCTSLPEILELQHERAL